MTLTKTKSVSECKECKGEGCWRCTGTGEEPTNSPTETVSDCCGAEIEEMEDREYRCLECRKILFYKKEPTVEKWESRVAGIMREAEMWLQEPPRDINIPDCSLEWVEKKICKLISHSVQEAKAKRDREILRDIDNLQIACAKADGVIDGITALHQLREDLLASLKQEEEEHV